MNLLVYSGKARTHTLHQCRLQPSRVGPLQVKVAKVRVEGQVMMELLSQLVEGIRDDEFDEFLTLWSDYLHLMRERAGLMIFA